METDTKRKPGAVPVEADPTVLHRILCALQSGAAEVGHPHDHVDEALSNVVTSPGRTILILGPSQADHRILEQVGAVVHRHPKVAAILVVAEPDTALLRAALRAGIADAVPLERIDDDLPAAIEELDRQLAAQEDLTRPESGSAPASAAGRVVSVFSAKGGVGKSTVAVNLASTLAERSNQRVVLVDADLQFGDVGVMLRLRPEHSILEAIAAGDQLDPVMLESLLMRDQRSGLFVLPAPTDPTSGAKITPQQITNLVGHLRELGTIAVVDMPSLLDDIVLQLLAESDDIVFVVGTDVPAVKNARLGLQAVELVQIPLGRVLVVLNRAESKGQLAPRDIEKILEMKVDFSLPADDLVAKSVNEGNPAVLAHSRSRFASRIRAMSELLLARSSAEAGR